MIKKKETKGEERKGETIRRNSDTLIYRVNTTIQKQGFINCQFCFILLFFGSTVPFTEKTLINLVEINYNIFYRCRSQGSIFHIESIRPK